MRDKMENLLGHIVFDIIGHFASKNNGTLVLKRRFEEQLIFVWRDMAKRNAMRHRTTKCSIPRSFKIDVPNAYSAFSKKSI